MYVCNVLKEIYRSFCNDLCNHIFITMATTGNINRIFLKEDKKEFKIIFLQAVGSSSSGKKEKKEFDVWEVGSSPEKDGIIYSIIIIYYKVK